MTSFSRFIALSRFDPRISLFYAPPTPTTASALSTFISQTFDTQMTPSLLK